MVLHSSNSDGGGGSSSSHTLSVGPFYGCYVEAIIPHRNTAYVYVTAM